MIVLRDYQESARAAALEMMARPPHERASFLRAVGAERQAALLAMATGSGKTECALGTIDSLFQSGEVTRALIISHTDELVGQPVQRIIKSWPTLPAPGIVKAGLDQVHAPIVSASIQTLSSNGRLDNLLDAGAFDLTWYDECHRIGARTPKAALKKLFAANPGMRLLGTSATPHRSDGYGIGQIFGPNAAYKISIKDAIYEFECITPFLALAARLRDDEHDFSNVRTNAVGDYAPGETGRILSLSSALEIIIEKWREVAVDRPTIAFTASVDQAHDLASAFCAAGFTAAAIDGTTPANERRSIIERFRNGSLQILCGCAVFIEGFDAPRASCAIIARPTQHDGSYIQMMGRALRWLDKANKLADDAGHRDAVIIDVVPKGARDLVLAKSIMGKPRETRKAEERAKEQGIVHELYPLPKFDFGIDADPDEVYLEILDMFSSSPLAWFTDGRIHSLAIGTTEDEHKHALSLMIAQNGGFDVWRIKHPKFIKNNFGKWERLPGGALHLGKFEDFEAASDAAQAYATDNGQGILNRRDKRWRQNDPSAGQITMLKKLGVIESEAVPAMNRGEASTLINHAQCLAAVKTLKKKGAIS